MSTRSRSFAILSVLVLPLLAAGCSPSKASRGQVKTDAPINAKGTQQGKAAEVANWFTKSPELDGVEGVQADRAYSELNLGSGSEVVVAVIDSGVDIEHEDLKDVIWTNPGEIPGNGIDDDHNGYVDDVHGWNFLGSYDKDGKPVNVNQTTLEMTRELVRMKKLKADTEAAGGTLTAEQQAYLDKVSKSVEDERAVATEKVDTNTKTKEALETPFAVIKDAIGIEFKDLTVDKTKAFVATTDEQTQAREKILEVFEAAKVDNSARVLRRIEYYQNELDTYLNESFNPRKDIIGDDIYNPAYTGYGNNDVKGPDASHGTHVSGIIAAVRDNNLGIQGIADKAKIMVLRAVPDGDEYDKDIALAVRYAVDNGAKVINMSFGKSYSPLKSVVDEAFQYAAAHGVVLVHAAGNENSDNNVMGTNYPNPYVGDDFGKVIPNWIEVGASSKDLGKQLPADFSNFGSKTVTLFAPGVDITSTVPDTNQYDTYSGTSMASPSTTGVAALVRSRHPELDGAAVKDLLVRTVRDRKDQVVYLPGTFDQEAPTEVLFGTLSVTGGIVDAYAALKSAAGLN